MMKNMLNILAILLLSISVIYAAEINVDKNSGGDYTSIQEAINNAVVGDTIIVAEGTYNELIDMKGKAITLVSTDPMNPSVMTKTIISGEGLNGSVITCDQGEEANTVISGFVITNGLGTEVNLLDKGYLYSCGGGMLNIGSSPTVNGCTFSGNTAMYGGGMFNENSSPTVSDCVFSGNTATGEAGGGGMCNIGTSSPAVRNCTFSENSTGDHCPGGGMSNYNSSSPVVRNSTFSGNTAHIGGGMYNYNFSLTVKGCTFSGNTANIGGGMCNHESLTTVTDSYFCSNTPEAIDGSYIDGGGNNLEFCPPARLTKPELFGDSDADGDVDIADFAAFAANWLVSN